MIGLGGRFRSLRPGGIIGSYRPNPYGIVGSFESDSIVTICGPGDAMDDIDIISQVSSPDISVELGTVGAFGVSVDLGHWTTVPHKIRQSPLN